MTIIIGKMYSDRRLVRPERNVFQNLQGGFEKFNSVLKMDKFKQIKNQLGTM